MFGAEETGRRVGLGFAFLGEGGDVLVVLVVLLALPLLVDTPVYLS
jgi:hypothetical protein